MIWRDRGEEWRMSTRSVSEGAIGFSKMGIKSKADPAALQLRITIMKNMFEPAVTLLWLSCFSVHAIADDLIGAKMRVRRQLSTFRRGEGIVGDKGGQISCLIIVCSQQLESACAYCRKWND